ncbi:uncharacterized protein [Amphiura filiformis]|uniref:uncharacterized protein n=1 Tax=Amphiura filiformis TaxID=82378 RepID=UPI003B2275F2
MDRRDRSTENIALQPPPVHPRGRREHAQEYSNVVSGQYSEPNEYPPPYYNTPNTDGTAKAKAKGGRKCNPCVTIIVAVLIFVVGIVAGGGGFYLLEDKIIKSEVSDTNECTSTPCLNGGQCVDDVNGYECQCLPGWTGQICETVSDTNECTSTPCRNGGQCVDGVNGYECLCLPGWTGQIYETGESLFPK